MPDTEITIGIISVGDKRFAGKIADPGEAVMDAIVSKGYTVKSYRVLPDDIGMIKEELIRLCAEDGADLVITTGGTGYSPRDCVPEATRLVAQRQVPSITEFMRFCNMNIIKGGSLSRGISAALNKTLIINLPDAPKAAYDNISFVMEAAAGELEHMSGHLHLTK